MERLQTQHPSSNIVINSCEGSQAQSKEHSSTQTDSSGSLIGDDVNSGDLNPDVNPGDVNLQQEEVVNQLLTERTL